MRIALATYEARSRTPDHKPDDRLLRDALSARGADALIASWSNAHVDWPAFDAVVLRSCWDSHHRPEAFRQWLRLVESTGPRLINARAVVEWNNDKERYLTDLLAAFPARSGEVAGRVTPSAFYSDRRPAEAGPFRSAHGRTLAELLAELDGGGDGDAWRGKDVIVKPTVSGDGDDTMRIVRTDPAPQPRTDDILSIAEAGPRVRELLAAKRGIIFQPFVAGIRDGEYSVVYVDGAATHAVRKLTARDGFKNRHERDRHGLSAAALPDGIREFADRIITYVTTRFGVASMAFARVDLVRDVDGCPTLMELELVDPNLQLVRIPEISCRALGRDPIEAELWHGEAAMEEVVGRLADAILARAGLTARPSAPTE